MAEQLVCCLNLKGHLCLVMFKACFEHQVSPLQQQATCFEPLAKYFRVRSNIPVANSYQPTNPDIPAPRPKAISEYSKGNNKRRRSNGNQKCGATYGRRQRPSGLSQYASMLQVNLLSKALYHKNDKTAFQPTRHTLAGILHPRYFKAEQNAHISCQH